MWTTGRKPGWGLQEETLLWRSSHVGADGQTLDILTTEAHSTASSHPPRSGSQCSPIRFHWRERLLRQQGVREKEGKEKVNHTHSAVAQRPLCATQHSASWRDDEFNEPTGGRIIDVSAREHRYSGSPQLGPVCGCLGFWFRLQ